MKGVWKQKLGFLKSLLNEKNRYKRMDRLVKAKKDDINAVSELAMNFLKNKIPVAKPALKKLTRYATPIRALGKRKHSLKKRREVLLNQTGAGFWRGLRGVHHCACRHYNRRR